MSGPEFDISLESPEVAVALHQADILPLGVQLDLAWKEQVYSDSEFNLYKRKGGKLIVRSMKCLF